MLVIDPERAKAWMLEVLRENHGCLTLASRQLDVSWQLLRQRVQQHGLQGEVSDMRRAWRERFRPAGGNTMVRRRDGEDRVP